VYTNEIKKVESLIKYKILDSSFTDICNKYCLDSNIRFGNGSKCCQLCIKAKKYIHFNCKLHLSHSKKELLVKPQRTCLSCLKFKDKSCLILKEEPLLFKLILHSFNIKLHIPDKEI